MNSRRVPIAQILLTIQGEQDCLGEPVLLLRLQGCNLNCPWCDTKYALDISGTSYYLEYSQLEEIFRQHTKVVKTILITGGEPTIYFSDIELFALISKYFDRLIIETNGTTKDLYFDSRYLETLFKGKEYRLDVSYKLDPNCYRFNISREDLFEVLKRKVDIVRRNKYYLFKFVHSVSSEQDILDFVSLCNLRRNEFVVMPMTPVEYIDHPEFFDRYRENCLCTIEFCINNYFRYSPREHIFVYYKRSSEQYEIVNILK